MKVLWWLLFVPGLALAAHNWSSVPLAQWTEARTVDACNEGMPLEGYRGDLRTLAPVPPFGTWREGDGAAQATGLTHCWSTMLLPEAKHDVVLTTRFTVTQSSGAARQLPGGCVRWGGHWGENLPGWDVGVVLGYQDALNYYRVSVSAARGELALWDATGGFLQLIPCQAALNVPHTLKIRWRGAHISAELDGKPVMDYWDRTLPYAEGRVGLSMWRSAVQFDQFAVTRAAGMPERMPAHVPDFHFAPADGLLQGNAMFAMSTYAGEILFDGHEPICYFYKMALPKDDDYIAGALMFEAVKLKPGWRAAYYTPIGPNGLKWNWRWPLLVGDLPAAFAVSESGKRLVFTFATEMPNIGRTDYTCTVSYDAKTGMYAYHYRGTLKLIADAKVNEFELSDPLTYNNRTPGPDVAHRWNPSGHRWWLYPGANGDWERMPLTDFPNDFDTRINNADTPWGKTTDFLYPDPAACPVFVTDLHWEKGRFSPGQCSWGYDFHHREMAPGTLKANTTRTFALTFTAMPPKDADAIFAKSTPMPILNTYKDVPLLPFNPRGTTFAHTTSWLDPSTTMIWTGGKHDTTTGHGDQYSLRVDGPGRAKVRMFHYMIERFAPRWKVSGWYKTRGIADGASLRFRVAYPGWAEKEQDFQSPCLFALDTADHDWQSFSFVTDAIKVGDESYIGIELPAAGTVWIDDIAITADDTPADAK